MRPGATLAQVRVALGDLARTVRERYPDAQVGFRFEAMTIQENLSGNQTGTLQALTTAVGFLLLTACETGAWYTGPQDLALASDVVVA
jgi:hypothetical protein